MSVDTTPPRLAPLVTRITEMFGLRYPIVQAGMSWASSCAALPIAVSRAGGLGVLGAGPLFIDDFRRILGEVQTALGDTSFAVNVPQTRIHADQVFDILFEQRARIIIASQGGVPAAQMARFHSIGARWFHVVASVEHARKAAAAGVDGLIVVGSEAGGHPPANGVTTLVLVRRVLQDVSIPVIAGGGVADGYGIAALLALGADAVQLGTRFLLTHEANVHDNYKAAVLATEIDGTTLVGRSRPVRTIKNRHAVAVADAETAGMPAAEYEALLKNSSLKLAALDGDVEWGKVEAGQSCGLVKELLSADAVMTQLIAELDAARVRLGGCAKANHE